MNIRILQAFMKKCRLCNKEPTWEGLRNFRSYIKKSCLSSQNKKLNFIIQGNNAEDKLCDVSFGNNNIGLNN